MPIVSGKATGLLSDNIAVPVVVIGNSSTNSLGIIRAFGRRGIPVFAISSDLPRSAAGRSRYITGRFLVRDWSEAELLRALTALRNSVSHKHLVVFISNDGALLTYARIRASLPDIFCDRVPPLRMLEFCVQKHHFYAWLKDKAIAHPKSALLNGALDNLEEKMDAHSFPYVLKPVESHHFSAAFHCKLFEVNSPADVKKARDRLMQHHLPMIIQELVPGNNYQMVSFYRGRGGSCWVASCFRKVLQAPRDFGTGSLIETIDCPELLLKSRLLLEQIGYEGIGEVEFMKDPRSGEYKVLEINARSITYNRLPAAFGMDLEYIYYLDALGKLPAGFSIEPLQAGLSWGDWSKDLGSAFGQIRYNSLTWHSWLQQFRSVDVDAYYAVDDKRPWRAELRGVLGNAMRHLTGRKTGITIP